jgi:hypothetical protein
MGLSFNSTLRAALALSLAIAVASSAAGAATAKPPPPPPKVKVFLYGDSLVQEAKVEITSLIAATGKAVVVARAFPGKAPCDYFDYMDRDMAANPGSLAIIDFYGNVLTKCTQDPSTGKAPQSDSEAFYSFYSGQFATAVAKLAPAAHVWFDSAPVAMLNRRRPNQGVIRKQRLVASIKSAISGHSNITYVDAGAALENPDGTFAAALACLVGETCLDIPSKGMNPVRSADGLHLCYLKTLNFFSVCPIYNSGAHRFAMAIAAPVIASLTAPS